MDINKPQSSMESLHMKKGCMPMRKTLFVKKIDTKKSSRASVSEVYKKIRLETLQEEKGSVDNSFLKTSHELTTPIDVDNNKKTLLNWRQIKEERRGRDKQEEKGSVEKLFLKTSHELAAPIAVDNNKKTLLNWRQIKEERRGRDIAYARLQARLQLDEMKDTAGLEHNMEAQRDFEKLIGVH